MPEFYVGSVNPHFTKGERDIEQLINDDCYSICDFSDVRDVERWIEQTMFSENYRVEWVGSICYEVRIRDSKRIHSMWYKEKK